MTRFPCYSVKKSLDFLCILRDASLSSLMCSHVCSIAPKSRGRHACPPPGFTPTRHLGCPRSPWPLGLCPLIAECPPLRNGGASESTSLAREPETTTSPTIKVEQSEFDFGPVLARGQVLTHEFALTNESGRAVRLLGSQAMTPCCSAIGPLPEIIPPGAAVKVPVSFKPGHESRRKRVEFAVRTDSPDVPTLVLAVMATATAEIEIRPDKTSNATLPLGRSGHQRLTILCRRIGQEGRGSPDGLDATPPLTAAFVGPTEGRSVPGHWVESTRDIEVVLPASSREGMRSGTVTLSWKGNPPIEFPIEWRVTPRIRATPTSIILRSKSAASRETHTVILRSDDAPFRITGVSGRFPPRHSPRIPASSTESTSNSSARPIVNPVPRMSPSRPITQTNRRWKSPCSSWVRAKRRANDENDHRQVAIAPWLHAD